MSNDLETLLWHYLEEKDNYVIQYDDEVRQGIICVHLPSPEYIAAHFPKYYERDAQLPENTTPVYKHDIPSLPEPVTRQVFTEEYSHVVLGDSGLYNYTHKNKKQSLIYTTSGYMKYRYMYDSTGCGNDICVMLEKLRRWVGQYANKKTYKCPDGLYRFPPTIILYVADNFNILQRLKD